MKILLIIAVFTSSCQYGINGLIEKGKNGNMVDGSRKLPGVVDDVMQVSSSAEDDFPDVMFVQTKSSFPRIPGILQAAGHVIREAAEVIKNDAKAKLEQIQTHLSNAMPAAPEPAFAGEANNFKSDPSFRHKMMSKSKSDEARVVARKEMASEGENGNVEKAKRRDPELDKLAAEAKRMLDRRARLGRELKEAEQKNLVDGVHALLQRQSEVDVSVVHGVPSGVRTKRITVDDIDDAMKRHALSKIKSSTRPNADEGSLLPLMPKESQKRKVFTVKYNIREGAKIVQGLAGEEAAAPASAAAKAKPTQKRVKPKLVIVAEGERKKIL